MVTHPLVTAFEKITRVRLPEHPVIRYETVCVLGGSIAGLLAARVLADHARTVVIVERDPMDADGNPRAGVPQGHQVHGIGPAGLQLLEQWFPGLTEDARSLGATLVGPDGIITYVDSTRQLQSGTTSLLVCSRPLLESRIRRRVLALAPVRTLKAQATGLDFHGERVTAVRYTTDEGPGTLAADLVVDAMGRAGRLPDWLEQAGYERPLLERMRTGMQYATALFERTGRHLTDPEQTAAQFTLPPGPGGLAVALAQPVENRQWLIGITCYAEGNPPQTVEDFRALCEKLPGPFAEAAMGTVTREPAHFHQADSRRRDFTSLSRFPHRLISIGDAVASMNAAYGQGMTSAALQASCLSDHLNRNPDPDAPADAFFAAQAMVVDALWSFSAGADQARQDAIDRVEVPPETRQARAARQQLAQAALVDETVNEALKAVAFGLAHPLTLTDPALLDRAAAVNRRAAEPS
ncbi:NAD(P)/FAD-dependent oxidoreductase [Streptomyces sp. NPDC004457]